MANLCLKKNSKRVTCKKRYKIEKKIREHHRKLKKVAKKAVKQKKKGRTVSSISVPNSCPFKEQILMEAEKQREFIKEEKARQKEVNKRSKGAKQLAKTKKST